MPTPEDQIEEILKLRQEAIAAALIEEAESLVPTAIITTYNELSKLKNRSPNRSLTGSPNSRSSHRAQVERGGTVLSNELSQTGAAGSQSHQKRFKPWLDDMTARDREEAASSVSQHSMHPRRIAEQLETYFENTNHNAVTAARTEGQKIEPMPGCDIRENVDISNVSL